MAIHDKRLKRCPFCGGPCKTINGEASEQVWAHGKFWRVFCAKCQARQLFHKTEAQAIGAWNHRPAPDEREIAALREDAERYRFWREVLAGDDKAAMDLFEEELNRDVATGNRPPTGKELDKAVDVARRLRAGKEGE